MRSSLRLAPQVGKRLGPGEVLLRAMSARSFRRTRQRSLIAGPVSSLCAARSRLGWPGVSTIALPDGSPAARATWAVR